MEYHDKLCKELRHFPSQVSPFSSELHKRAASVIEQLAARVAALDALEVWLRRDYAVYCGITIYAEDPGKPFQIELRPGRRDVDAPHENAIWCRDHADLASAIRAALARVIAK